MDQDGRRRWDIASCRMDLSQSTTSREQRGEEELGRSVKLTSAIFDPFPEDRVFATQWKLSYEYLFVVDFGEICMSIPSAVKLVINSNSNSK